MKKGILWMLLSFLLVASLMLPSCVKEEVVEEEEEEEEEVIVEEEEEEEVEEVVPEVGEPQYGGTLTKWIDKDQRTDPPTPDRLKSGASTAFMWLDGIEEHPIMGDIEKYGPRGTGEYSFKTEGYIPPKYWKGKLVESWEFSQEKAIWHVRPGIYWRPNEDQIERGVMEEPREFVADDLVFFIKRFREGPAGVVVKDNTGDVYATDRYTCVMEFTKGFNPYVLYLITTEDRAVIECRETVEAGAEKFENHVGTGPFLFGEYVVGSHMTFIRNPDYWDTTTINGKEYQLPFIDKLVGPIIPDMATRIAALRTGTIDHMAEMDTKYWAELERTAPGLQWSKGASWGAESVALKWNEPPLDDIRVRRALWKGTNRSEFRKLLGVPFKPETNWYPLHYIDPATHIPLEELPEDIQTLYEYDRVEAKRMLAEAGYPEGIKLELVIASDPAAADFASMLANEWSKIGVELDIIPYDRVTWNAVRHGRTFKHLFYGNGFEMANSLVYMNRYYGTGATLNIGGYSNPKLDEILVAAGKEMDPDRQNQLIKEAALEMIKDVPAIPIYTSPSAHAWWPWVKNYYGEWTSADNAQSADVYARCWIDEDLKAEMGY